MRIIAAAVALATACISCGGADDSEQSPPDSCEPSDRHGTYFVTATTISGNCGPQASSLVSLDPMSVQAMSADCAIISERTSGSGCKVERHFICPYEELERGATIEFVGVTEQQTQDGSLITGTLTMTLRDAFEALVCFGTYDVRYERR